ncbi:hypothetical protein TrCOL_g7731 [Triparma columacea]|uniref:Adaptor protein ClpS core domain-containing protein n=1 Tax=Triparma columacea TaxID=722753 RepID=A0A9W7GET6_9STRA|nr:hypothetical protein TrCOL_g7731 [Triparma columacea]
MRAAITLLTVLLSISSSATFAFFPSHPPLHSSPTRLFAAPAGPALKQKVTLKSKTVAPGPAAPKAKTAEPKTRGEIETEDAPRYKVLLIGDEEYVEEHVVERMVDVVDDLDKKRSIEVYYAAQKGGKGLVGVYPLELSEFYVEQLLRSEPMIFSELEKEGKA